MGTHEYEHTNGRFLERAEETKDFASNRRLGRKARKKLVRGPTTKPKHEDQLQKQSTSKLTNFWRTAGVSEPEIRSELTPGSSSSHSQPSTLPGITLGEFYVPLASIPEGSVNLSRSNSDRSKMDASRLAPGPFEGPNKEMQIKDAQDMYQTVLRNAERSNSSVPPYDFIELIGKGSFGRVYKCKKRATGDLVAVKIINIDDADFQEHVLEKDNTIDSFRKEVGILQQLKDAKAKNVNLIHDAFDLHNQLWIVSDYCTGGSVRTLMRANPSPKQGLEEHFIIPIARELAIAIKSVHDIGVIHRDIKCANVYVNEEGEIQLGDFGIVGVMDDGSSKRRTIIGTPHYLPRELLVSSSHLTDEGYGTEVDIWSYGITVYEMATGQPPHSTLHPEDVARAIENAPRLEGGDYSQDLRNFVAFCLNSDPQERPSADAVLKHPYIAGTSRKHPTNSLVRLIDRYAAWEYKGGQRQSLFFRGGAAAPSPHGDDGELDDQEGDNEWNFSTSESFDVAFGRRYSQMAAAQEFADMTFEAPPGSGLPPIITKDLTPFERMQEQFQELSANRGERSLGRLWNPTTQPYELHTPVDDPGPLSDLPLRNMTSAGPTRESLIDLDTAGGLDLNVPSFNFEFGDVPTLKAKTARQASLHEDDEEEEEEYQYSSQDTDDKRTTIEWKFPSLTAPSKVTEHEPKRATMDWTFPSHEPNEPKEPEVEMNLPPAGLNGLPPGFRPHLQRIATEPVGQTGDFMHPALPTLATLPIPSSPVRDSVASMIDLDMGLADPADIVRPSTASSATGSTMTDMTSGNPFDLEEDPQQNQRDRDRFSYHKQWQSEGGPPKRLSHKTMAMHSRASSLTDSDPEPVPQPLPADTMFDYDYSRQMSDTMRHQLLVGIPAEETELSHWPNFALSLIHI